MSGKLDINKVLNKKNAFDRIKPKKREKIIKAAVDEFADTGYEMASTNRIAKKAGVSKGAIFKYFGTKEKLFLALAEKMFGSFIQHIIENLPGKTEDAVDLYLHMIEHMYDHFGEDLQMFKLFKTMLSDRGGDILMKLRKEWEPYMMPLLLTISKGVDMSKYSLSKRELVKLFMWIDTALDTEVMSKINSETTAKEIKKMYNTNLVLVKKILKNGIYK